MKLLPIIIVGLGLFWACNTTEEIAIPETSEVLEELEPVVIDEEISAATLFQEVIDFDNIPNYANQSVPDYIREDNTNGNDIRDEVAVLGRVLFYDKQLSSDNTISCASCHKQAFAFGDDDLVSQGVNGTTGRHSMRLINARFSRERRFFWDERASTLEEQTTMPIQDHIEMGFSGADGDEGMVALIEKLGELKYMQDLFTVAYGSEEITEEKMQTALAQFVRSIQSFDSKYDEGRPQVVFDEDDFPNFTDDENLGKALFMGRARCDRCHHAPEFSIVNDSQNNGVIATLANDGTIDLTITRSPTLRDIFNSSGTINGPMMHNGSFTTIAEVIQHYSKIPDDPQNPNLDVRLRGGRDGEGQRLNLDDAEVEAITAFIATLSGRDVYTNDIWSDPFVNIGQ